MSAPKIPLLDIVKENEPLRDEIMEAIAEVVDSGRFLHGPAVSAFEAEIAEFCQVEHAISCASGSDALLLSLMALGIGPGDEVIVPSFTFFATASCISRLGARIVFADIDATTFQLDPNSVSSLVSPATRAIIPVHLFGHPAPLKEIQECTSKYNIEVIEDAAQSIGATYHGRPVGGHGQIGCFSFYPTKNLGGMGDGGMLVTDDSEIADSLRLLAAHGMRPRYYHSVIGIASRMDTIQAAALRIKLRHLPRWIAARRQRAERYESWMQESGLDEHLELPSVEPRVESVWNQYTVRIPSGRRDEVREFFQERGIGTEVYYPVPLHHQACFRGADVRWEDLSQTEQVSHEVLSLPISPSLTEEQQRRVVSTLAEFYGTGVAMRRESA